MPIISTIGRRAPRVRLLIATIALLLTAGSITMVYPFLLMVAGSTKSAVDTNDNRVVPAFLTDDRALYRKHIEGLFNESLDALQQTYGLEVPSFRAVEPPAAPNRPLVAAWREFLAAADLPATAYACAHIQAPVSRGVAPSALRNFKAAMAAAYGGDLQRMNRATGMRFPSWGSFYVLREDYLQRRNRQPETPFASAFESFKRRQPLGNRYYFSPEGLYRHGFLMPQYGRSLAAYNAANGTRHAAWSAVRLATTAPAPPSGSEREREDWLAFVRSILGSQWLRIGPAAAAPYHAFLEAKYRTVAALNRHYGTDYAAFDAIAAGPEFPARGLPLADWESFLQGWKDPTTGRLHVLPAEALAVRSTETRFRDWLRQRYATPEAAGAALSVRAASWDDFAAPQRDLHYLDFLERRGELRREFLVRNYLIVFDVIVLRGRSVLNTAIYCLLSILCALTVNPIAAYALSRYRPPSTYKVLLFLMLTMAFPPMVTQIPNFLLLRELGLLNTFWALVLPHLANGYSIFLLKGFFDSLPRELYESAQIDGAGEFRIFWQITMSLSTPILAVIALGAFTGAYSNFMMALLICQDSKMWTLMPWLYQLQQGSGQGVVFASLIVAAVPTFVVFVFCQKVIMRGIVVPVEK